MLRDTGPGLRALLVVAALVLAPAAGCAALDEMLATTGESESSTPADGLREALRVGTGRAVEKLASRDGYLKRNAVRILVPDRLEPVEKGLRLAGRGDLVDEFVTSMNRAAEAAAPLARDVFLDSIRQMSFSDAMTILRGQRHEATDYFRENAGPRLAEVFRPLVEGKLDDVGATRSFNDLMRETARLPLVERPVFDLGEYVTAEALDGLFLMLAREEEKIRTRPAARTTELLRRWFGSERR